MDGSESVRLLLKKQHPVKRQPHSATTLKKWRGEESPSVLRRRGCQICDFLSHIGEQQKLLKEGAMLAIGVNLREEVPIFVDGEPLSLDVADVQL